MAQHDPARDAGTTYLRDKCDWLELRLAKLEAGKGEAARMPGSPGRWGWVAEIPKWSPVITPIIVAVLGTLLAYYLTGYFQQSLELRKLGLENQKLELQVRQVELGGIGEMRELVAELYRDGITPSEAKATALSLAAFGALAAPPLIGAIETGSANRRTGAEAGLAAAALTAPREVCAALAAVLDNRTALFGWQTQKSAVRLLGQLGCEYQRLSIAAFGRLLRQGVDGYRPTVREDGFSEVSDVVVRELLDEQERALERIEMAAQVAGSAPPLVAGEGGAGSDSRLPASGGRSGGAD